MSLKKNKYKLQLHLKMWILRGKVHQPLGFKDVLKLRCNGNFDRHSKSSIRPFVYISSRKRVFPLLLYDNAPFAVQRLAHTAKGWKAFANPEIDAKPSCEEGTGAVTHLELLSTLNACKTVDEQICTLSMNLSLTSEDQKTRKQFCESLEEAFRPFFTKIKIHQFGSSMNTFGFRGCDVDVCVQTVFDSQDKPEHYSTVIQVPQLDDVLNGTVERSVVDRMHPKQRLRFIRRIIRKHCDEINNEIVFIKGRCPLLRFYHSKYKLYCDFSCENRFALLNTKLMRFLSHIDERIGLLVRFLRYWGKHGKFVGDLDMFNSYAFSLIVMHFFQNTSPAILPPLNALLDNDYLNFGDVGDDDLLKKCLCNVPCSENKQSPSALLREFFFFYSYYDFSRIILLRKNSAVHKNQFQVEDNAANDVFERSAITVQDPFRLSFNATACSSYNSGYRFLLSLISACKVYQVDNAWNPGSYNWGLSLLLESANNVKPDIVDTIAESLTIKLSPEISESVSQNCESIESIRKAYLTKAAYLLMKLMEHGLLFHCKVLHVDQELEDRPLLMFRCEALQNTWTGRSGVHKQYHLDREGDGDILELEHQISNDIVKDREEKTKVLFKCLCECYCENVGDTPAIKLKIQYNAANNGSGVAVFLKEYLPKYLNRLL